MKGRQTWIRELAAEFVAGQARGAVVLDLLPQLFDLAADDEDARAAIRAQFRSARLSIQASDAASRALRRAAARGQIGRACPCGKRSERLRRLHGEGPPLCEACYKRALRRVSPADGAGRGDSASLSA